MLLLLDLRHPADITTIITTKEVGLRRRLVLLPGLADLLPFLAVVLMEVDMDLRRALPLVMLLRPTVTNINHRVCFIPMIIP